MIPYDINIESIDIIIKKTEKRGFVYINPQKATYGFVLFTKGTAYFTKENEKPVLLNKDSLVLLNKGDRYKFHSDTGCEYITSAFSFTPITSTLIRKLPTVSQCPQEIRSIILESESVWQSQKWDSHILCRIYVTKLYYELLRSAKNEPAHVYEQIAERAKEYIHCHFKENFTSNDISSFCRVSPSHLRTVFEKQTGQTVTEYRNKLRISTAKEMLTSAFFSVKETASELGYCDVYYFSKSFKKETGVSPAEFIRSSKQI